MKPGNRMSSVQETLTPLSAQFLRNSITDARAKGHTSVLPLHLFAVIMKHSSSNPLCPLRRACIQSKKDNSLALDALEPWRALVVCFEVALERMPRCTDGSQPPPVGLALAAALKRAQAHQRRGTPEQSLQPLLAVKVEVDQLIISLLDDPNISRVFIEAGILSTDVKDAMERSVAHAALTGPPMDSSSEMMRRGRFSALDSGQFRLPMFSNSPFDAEASSSSHPSRPVVDQTKMRGAGIFEAQEERELACRAPAFSRQDSVARTFSPSMLSMGEKVANLSPHQRVYQPREELHGLAGNGRSTELYSVEATKHIVNVLMSREEKRNPVLVSDSQARIKNYGQDFANRLHAGDVPPQLHGLRVTQLPLNSLSGGLFSGEQVEQKLAHLRSSVDGMVRQPGGGAVINLGDLQWLLEDNPLSESPVFHTHAHRVVEELQDLMTRHANNRVWLLASASPQTFHRCLSGQPSAEKKWSLQPVMDPFTNHDDDCSPAPSLPRHAVFQFGGGNVPTSKLGETVLDKTDCCPDCLHKFQQECSIVLKEESTLSLNSGMGSPVQHQWLSMKDTRSDTKKMQDLRHIWAQRCAAEHHVLPTSVSASQSPVSGITSTSQDRTSRMIPKQQLQHTLLSMDMSRWAPEPMKMMDAKPIELAARHVSSGAAHSRTMMDHPLLSMDMTSRWKPDPKKPLGSKPLELPGHHAISSSPAQVERTSLAMASPFRIALNHHMKGLDAKPSDLPGAPGQGSRMMDHPLLSMDMSSKWIPEPVKTRAPELGRHFATVKGNAGTAPGWMRNDNPKLGMTSPSPRIGMELALSRMASGQPARDLREGGEQPLSGGGLNFLSHSSKFQPFNKSSTPRQGGEIGATFAGRLDHSMDMLRPQYLDYLDDLSQNLIKLVPGEKAAVTATAFTVARCRSGEGRRRGSCVKTDTWLMFLGPDVTPMRDVAKALAKLLFTSEKNVIGMEFGMISTTAIPRGRALDTLVQDLKDRLCSVVVLLENIDESHDVQLRRSLVRAMETGKLADSTGKEMTVPNVIFIMTSSDPRLVEKARNQDENGPMGTCGEKLGRLDKKVLGRNFSSASSVTHEREADVDDKEAVEKSPADGIVIFGSHMFKRKASPTLTEDTAVAKSCKKDSSPLKKSFSLDLNLSAEENMTAARDDDEASTAGDDACERRPQEPELKLAVNVEPELKLAVNVDTSRDAVLEEMYSLLDATVVFKSVAVC